MNSFSKNASLQEYLQKIIYSYVDLDDATAIVVLNFGDDSSPLHYRYKNYTSAIFQKFMSNTRSGSAQRQFGITFSSFLSGVLLSVAFCFFQIIAFNLLRTKFDHIYQPNCYLFSEMKDGESGNAEPLAEPLKKNMWAWVAPTWKSSLDEYKEYGLDAFFFLRFLRTLSVYFFILSIVIVPILLPIHYMSGYRASDIEHYLTSVELGDKVKTDQVMGNLPYGLEGLDKISMSNIAPPHNGRLIFHVVLSFFAVGFFHYVLLRELMFYVSVRNKILSDDSENAKSYQYVMYLNNISKGININRLEYFFEALIPGSVKDIVPLPSNWKTVKEENQRFRKLVNSIENAQLNIIKTMFFNDDFEIAHNITSKELDYEEGNPIKEFIATRNPIRFKKEPTKEERFHRLLHLKRKAYFQITEFFNGHTFMGFYLSHSKMFKYHVPRLAWSRSKSLEKRRNRLNSYFKSYEKMLRRYEEGETGIIQKGDFPKQAFIVFKKVGYAHIFDQILLSDKYSEMSDKVLGINPDDIIWCNLALTSKTWALIRIAVSNFLNVIIIIGWVLPVAFVGFVSQIPIIAKLVPILTGLKSLPDIISRPLTSILPAVTLIFLTEGVPIFFRWSSIVKCTRTWAQVEIDVQKWFFAFLFVHIFLVVTISSGISVIIETVFNSPIDIPHLLGTNLPKCSNFFCSFVFIRGVAYFGGNLLQLKNLICYTFFYRSMNKTPREKLEFRIKPPQYQWGSLYPIFSVLGSISIIYSVIAPVILPLASFCFIFVMFSFKYSLRYQYRHENSSETLGKFYPQALLQLYSGVYFLEVSLIGLFALANKFKLSLIMFIFMIFTISAHFQISNLSNSLTNNIPANLASDELSITQRKFQIWDSNLDLCKIWIPTDSKNIGKMEIETWKSKYDVEFIQENAKITVNGKVEVSASP